MASTPSDERYDDIYLIDPDGRQPKRLTGERGNPNLNPDWSPDGGELAFEGGAHWDIRRALHPPDDPDGSQQRNLTPRQPALSESLTPLWSHGNPSWQPRDRRGPRIALRGIPCRCVRGGFRVRASAPDVSGLSEAQAFVDGRLVLTARRASFSVFVRAGLLRAGRHRLRVSARDTVGNRSARAVRFVRCRGSAA